MQVEQNNQCGVDFKSSWTTAAMAIHGAVKFVRDDLTLVEVMGYTGHAFRININEEDVNVAGPTAYEWCDILPQGLKNLGFNCKTLRTESFTPPTPSELSDAIAMIQASIDRGIPAITWDLFIPEFGNIYGYDDDKQELLGKDPRGDGPIQYGQLGKGETTELFVMTLMDNFDIDKKEMLKGALKMAIDHAYHREHKFEVPPYENGFKGYDAWVKAFTNRSVNEFGNSYNAAVVCCAREFASEFFRISPGKWQGDSTQEQEVKRLSIKAGEHYEEIATYLKQLTQLFPFPHGGNPNEEGQAEKAIKLLQEAKNAEQKAVAILEEMYVLLEK